MLHDLAICIQCFGPMGLDLDVLLSGLVDSTASSASESFFRRRGTGTLAKPRCSLYFALQENVAGAPRTVDGREDVKSRIAVI
jgi:hypothetical protein